MKKDIVTLACSFTANAGQASTPRTCSKGQSRTIVGVIIPIFKIATIRVPLNVLDKHIIVTSTKFGLN